MYDRKLKTYFDFQKWLSAKSIFPLSIILLFAIDSFYSPYFFLYKELRHCEDVMNTMKTYLIFISASLTQRKLRVGFACYYISYRERIVTTVLV